VLERFTERARHVVVLASEEARGFKHDSIGTEHILLGLIREEEGLAAHILASLDVTLERARGEVVRVVGVGQDVVTGQIPLTPSAKQVLEASLREAIALGHNYIGTEHILLGLVSLDDGAAARILLDLDASPQKIRAETIQALSAAGAIRSRPRPDDPHGSDKPPPWPGQIPSGFEEWIRVGPGAGVRRLLLVAAGRALDDGRSVIEARDVLLALTRDDTVAPVLADLGVDEAAVLDALARRRRS
jgi:ATP-dependent Clp protease ATP-binding subunit ClpC